MAVDLATIRYTDPGNGRRYIYLTPPPAQAALLDFDHEIVPEPFRVKMHAMQIIEPRLAEIEEPSSPLNSAGEVPAEGEATDVSPSLKKRPRRRAELIPNPAGGGTVPIKLNGNPPPIGPMARGKGTATNDLKYRTGRMRGFGLRVMGH